MGQLRIIVAGENLTESVHQEQRQPHVGWYLSPVLHWLAAHWGALLHEERFSWPERTRASAASACRRALDSHVTASDPRGREIYRRTHAWYHRHGLRSAVLGGIFPDLFIRRWNDDVELSWTAEPPLFAPDGLIFASRAGHVRIGVAELARPLWEMLRWAVKRPPELLDAYRDDHGLLSERIDKIGRLDTAALEREHVPEGVFDTAKAAFEESGHSHLFESGWSGRGPWVEAFSPAVAMFGGASPDLGPNDVQALRDALAGGWHGQDGAELSALLESRQGSPLDVPHLDGARFAADLLEDLDEPDGNDLVDVRRICARLDIVIEEIRLETDSIRGVAIAGEGFFPRILINLAHVFNTNEDGKRFTIAHELCHILFDRTRARRIAHVSGPWVAPGIEKRANAFAAYLLMPRARIVRNLGDEGRLGSEGVKRLAGLLHVNESALVEHLFNIDLISYEERERLRAASGWWQ